MPTHPARDEDRLAEGSDLILDPDAADPADLAGTAASDTADHQHGEVDQLAAEADHAGPGHTSPA